MILFSKKGKITPQDNKTNIKFDFEVPDNIKKLTVKYSYFPKTVDDNEKALRITAQGLKRYGANPADAPFFLPVKNLVTLSFDECGQYRGACHRHPNQETVIISDSASTPGIINREIQSGLWDVVLGVHFAGCEIDYKIDIIGEEK